MKERKEGKPAEKPELEVSAYENEDGNIFLIEFSAIVSTIEVAKEIAAKFPKYIGVKASTITSTEWSGPKGFVGVKATLLGDEVNKGINETGLKRVRKIATLVTCKFVQPLMNAVSANRIKAILGGK